MKTKANAQHKEKKEPTLKDVVKLLNKKYGDITAVIFFGDESGRIVSEMDVKHPYDQEPLFNFREISQLVSHLEEE